jgi:hypothetical protein
MLAATDRLDRTLCGRPVNILANPASNRRTIYAFMDRSDFATLFRAFDVASPDQHAPLRFETTVPQQALFLLNAIQERSEAVSCRLWSGKGNPTGKGGVRSPSRDAPVMGCPLGKGGSHGFPSVG